MANHMSIIAGKTAAGLAAWAKSWVGQVYWYGTYAQPCTQSRLDSKAKQYPAHYGASRMATYRKHIADKRKSTDCVGLIKGYLWANAAGDPVYDKLTDKSANGMYSAAKVRGAIGSIPERPGLLVRYDGHIGVYLGNGEVVEARGFAYGVVMTRLSARPWTNWCECPYLAYGASAAALPDAIADAYPLGFGERSLRLGHTGADVACLQRALIALDYSVGKWGCDGDFGTATHNALAAYQHSKNLTSDGVCGPKTRAALECDLPDTHDTDEDDAEITPAKLVTILGGNANIRLSPDTGGKIMGVARNGDSLPFAGETSPNGWQRVWLDREAGWISGLYAKLEG